MLYHRTTIVIMILFLIYYHCYCYSSLLSVLVQLLDRQDSGQTDLR